MVGQAADQASVVGQADAGTTADSSQLKATQWGASCTTSHAAVLPPSLTAILPDRLHHTHSCAKAQPCCRRLPGAWEPRVTATMTLPIRLRVAQTRKQQRSVG